MNPITMQAQVTRAMPDLAAQQRRRALAALRPQLAAQSRLRSQAAAGSSLAWWLFIVLNGLAIMRPTEVIPQLANQPLYQINILLCLITGAPAILELMRSKALWTPVTLCVFGMLVAILASTLPHGDYDNAQAIGVEFVKVFVYYVLLLALVNSPARMRQLLAAIVIFALILNALAVLRFHNLIALDTVKPLQETQFQASRHAKPVIVERLQAAGIYGNPNDLARIIDVAITICLFFMLRKSAMVMRIFWTLTAAALTYALALTFSRGGLLALIAGIVILFHARYGMKKGAFLLLLLLPALAIFGGRQTDITTESGTGQLRVQLWSEGLVQLRNSPLFGIGAGHYFHAAGNHAHNSFIEAYVETGFFGGTFFTGAFFLVTTALFKFKSEAFRLRAPELASLRPFVLSLVVGTIVSQFSSSREYSLPTYIILGVAAAYLLQADRRLPHIVPRMSGSLVVKLILVSALTLTTAHLYTMFSAHF